MPKAYYGIIGLLIALYIFVLADRSNRKREKIAVCTARICLLGSVIVLSYSFVLLTNNYMMMSVCYSLLFICIDFMLVTLLSHTMQITGFGEMSNKFRIPLLAFTAVDSVMLLLNPWTNLALEYNQVLVNGDLYLEYMPRLWYKLHLTFSYILVVAVLVILVVKCCKIPLVYAGKYLSEIAGVIVIVILNLLFLTSTLYIDYSIALYGFVALIIYKLTFNYRPTLMRIQAKHLSLHKLQEPLILFDINGLMADYNEEAEEKFNLTRKHLGYMTRQLFEEDVLRMSYDEDTSDDVSRELVIKKDYADIVYQLTVQKLNSKKGRNMGTLYVLHDITERKRMYNAIEKISMYDSVTGFYRGRAFEKALEGMEKEADTILMAVCNISGLKLLNAVYGRKTGDRVIQVMAEELRKVLPEDTLFSYMEDDYTVIATQGLTVEQLDLYLFTAARKIKQRAISKIPVFLNYGIAERENKAVSAMEYVKYAEMELTLKKGREAGSQKKLMTQALTEEYFRNKYESIEHVKRIRKWTGKMAEKLSLSAEDRRKLDLLCIYHDIGRVKTRTEIWNRAGVITKDERDVLKLHPITGYQIVSELHLDEDISQLVLYHHENYDGSGYPYGVSKEEIPLLARILAIVDIYDIMVNEQLYKGAVTEETALQELHKYSGIQFDPDLVNLFEECLKEG